MVVTAPTVLCVCLKHIGTTSRCGNSTGSRDTRVVGDLGAGGAP